MKYILSKMETGCIHSALFVVFWLEIPKTWISYKKKKPVENVLVISNT